MSRVKHARPPSPGDRHSKKHISQDLLFLQAVSNAHNTANKGTVMLQLYMVVKLPSTQA